MIQPGCPAPLGQHLPGPARTGVARTGPTTQYARELSARHDDVLLDAAEETADVLEARPLAQRNPIALSRAHFM